jgi:hypothetical protein
MELYVINICLLQGICIIGSELLVQCTDYERCGFQFHTSGGLYDTPSALCVVTEFTGRTCSCHMHTLPFPAI